MNQKQVGLFLPASDAMRAATILERIIALSAPGVLRDSAEEVLDVLRSGDVGEFQACATGPVDSSDLQTFERNRALHEQNRARIEAVQD